LVRGWAAQDCAWELARTAPGSGDGATIRHIALLAQHSDDQALIAHLRLQIEKLNRDRYGPRSERTARLLDQLELQLAELEASATADELAAEMVAAKTTKVASFIRKRPSRQPFPEHLPRERVIVPRPTACACCGSWWLSKRIKKSKVRRHIVDLVEEIADDE
jgi:hypothetical protein